MKLDVSTLQRINTATKYPSIPTYHPIGERGRLGEPAAALEGRFSLTEKIDGTNARIVLGEPFGYLIGSREELLHCRGDVIHNPALGIVDGIRSVAERLSVSADGLKVLFGEFYGGKTTAASKEYAKDGSTGYRVFDAVEIGWSEIEGRDLAALAMWRENGGQRFLGKGDREALAAEAGVETVPPVGEMDAAEIPTSFADVLKLLEELVSQSRAVLDEGSGARAEGIVIRTDDRKQIYKLRFDDYRRTLRGK
jgi:hypothetical protein